MTYLWDKFDDGMFSDVQKIIDFERKEREKEERERGEGRRGGEEEEERDEIDLHGRYKGGGRRERRERR